ncbi:non-specific lipid-transfer protein 1-like [Carex rostrata]
MARLAMLAALAIVLMVAAPAAEAALSCGQVTGYIASCIPYAESKVPTPSSQCCTGVKTLNSIAKSTPDRQAACNCLKNAAKTMNGLNAGKVAGIPGKCGVSVPYVIGTTTDCSKVR